MLKARGSRKAERVGIALNYKNMKPKSALFCMMLCMALLASSMKSYCQWTNILNNPSFEAGSVPPGSTTPLDPIGNYVTDWSVGCGSPAGSPDIFDPSAPPCGSPNSVDAPNNKWGALNAFAGSRYVGFTNGEPVLGTLSQTLITGCTYRVRMRAAISTITFGNCGANNQSNPADMIIEVRLRNSVNTCNTGSLLRYTSGTFNTTAWNYFDFTFVATAAMAGYDRIEFKSETTTIIQGNPYSRPVYLDDVGLDKASVAITVVGGGTSVCAGEQVNLTSVNGGTWTAVPNDPSLSGQENNASIFVTPQVTTIYTNSSGCSSSSVTINVNSNPTVDLGPDLTLCNGPINLDAGDGYPSYDWTLPGICLYGGQYALTCVSGTYCVTVENDDGCTAYDCVDIILSSSPSVTATASQLDPCQGDTVYLGALSSCTNCTYLWSNGAQTPGTVVNPTVTTTYTVTITNPDGCTASASITITPVVCGSEPICKTIQKVGNNDIGEAVVATQDGGCAIAGTMFDPFPSADRDMYFVKYDSDLDGTTVISKRIGGIYADEGYSVVHRPGDGYYIAGTAILSATEHNIYVAKLREDGVQLWGYMYGTDNNRIEAARKIIDMSNLSEAALMIVGFTNSTSTHASNFDVLAIKIRTNGTLIAQNTFGGPNFSNDYGYDVARYDKDPLNNVYFIVGERELASAQDAIVIKVDQSLTYMDSEIINNSGRNEVANAVAVLPKTNGADVFVAGSISNTGNGLRDLYIFKLTTILTPGASPNSVIFGNTSSITYEVAYKMKITKDDKLILAGENGDNTASGFDGLVLKVDPATLSLDWVSTTNLQGVNEHFRDVAQLTDNSYVGTGFYTVSSTDRDILVSRITDQGISCCLFNYEMADDKGYTGSAYLKPKTPVLDTKGYGGAVNYYQEDKICSEPHHRDVAQNSEAFASQSISIAPNPNAGEFVVALMKSTSTIKAVNIIDISGRIVQTMVSEDAMVSKLDVSISQFDSGIYFVEVITSSNERYTTRVVVQK